MKYQQRDVLQINAHHYTEDKIQAEESFNKCQWCNLKFYICITFPRTSLARDVKLGGSYEGRFYANNPFNNS